MSDDARRSPRRRSRAMNDAFGEHDGRVVHVKGGWAEGTFTATAEGAALCRAEFLDGRPFRALVRFSNGGGNPDAHDGDRGGRGIAREALPRRRRAHRPPRHLGPVLHRAHARRLRRVREAGAARSRAPASPTWRRSARFSKRIPRPAAALGAAGALPPPASWLAVTYNGIHTFRWSAADGTRALGAHPLGSRRRRGDAHRRGRASARPRLPRGRSPRAASAGARRRSRCWRGSRKPEIRSTIRPRRGPRIATAVAVGRLRRRTGASSRPRRRATFGCSTRCGCATASSRRTIRSCASARRSTTSRPGAVGRANSVSDLPTTRRA